MTATNQQMTREHLDELKVVAVTMQQDAEKLGERPVAVFAYAVQLALAELQRTKQQLAAVVAENAALKNPDNWLSLSDYGYEASEVADGNGASEDEALRAGMTAIINRITTPATDAFLVEVRAAEAKSIYEGILDNPAVTDMESLVDWLEQHASDAVSFAAQLRQGAEQ